MTIRTFLKTTWARVLFIFVPFLCTLFLFGLIERYTRRALFLTILGKPAPYNIAALLSYLTMAQLAIYLLAAIALNARNIIDAAGYRAMLIGFGLASFTYMLLRAL